MTNRIKIDDVVPGKTMLRVEATAGFICLPTDSRRIVYLDDNGLPYVHCNSANGKHYLDNEIDEYNYLIGFEALT